MKIRIRWDLFKLSGKRHAGGFSLVVNDTDEDGEFFKALFTGGEQL